MLRPTPSKHTGKDQLVLGLGTSIVASLNVLLGIAAIGRFLMVDAPFFIATCLQGVPIFHIETTGETIIHIVKFLHNVGVCWGHVSCIPRLAGAKHEGGNTNTASLIVWGTSALASSPTSTLPPRP